MPSQAKNPEDNVALVGKRDAKLPPLNQLEPSVCEAFLGSGILDCPVTYRASYPPFLGLDVEILSFTLPTTRPRQDVTRHAPALRVSRRSAIVGTVRFGIALGIAFEVSTSISRSLLLAIFPNVPPTWKIDSQKNLWDIARSTWREITEWYMNYARIVRTITFIIKLIALECITDLYTFFRGFFP